MSHLGRWLSALVDCELDGEERDRVLNHLAGCRACLAEVTELRAIKRRLTALGEGSADTAMTDRLIDLARCDQESLENTSRLASSWSTSSSGLDGRWSLQVRQARRLRSWRMATGTAGTALLAIGFAAFVLGSAQAGRPEPRVTPSVDAYWLQHSFDLGQEPATTTGSANAKTPASPGLPGPGFLGSGRPGVAIAPTPQLSPAPLTPATGKPVVTPAPGTVSVSPGTPAPRRSPR